MDWSNSGSYTLFTHLAYADEYGPGYHPLHAEDGVPEHRHWTGITNARTNMAFTLGLPAESAAFVSLPVDTFFNSARYTLADGVTPYTPPKAEIHHRNETLFGPGDAIVMGKRAFAFEQQNLTLVPSLGVSVPFGRTEDNPITRGHEGLWHQHIQFGSGTWDPMVGLEAGFGSASEPWGIDAWLLTRQALYFNDRGFRFGGRIGGGIYPRWKFSDGLTFTTGIEAIHEGTDQWRDLTTGVTSSPENSGRDAVMLVAGVAWHLKDWGVTLTPQIRKIAWQNVQGGDMEQPFALSIGASYLFGSSWAQPEP